MQITWNIAQLDRNPSDGFVGTAHWTVLANDGNYFATAYGTCGFQGELTTPYENLTQEQVLNWVWEQVNKEEVEDSLAAQIELQKNPVSATGMPW